MYQPEQPVFDQAIESNIEITYRSSSYRLCSCPYRCSVDFLLSGC